VKEKAQSFLEYALVLVVITAALLAMYPYMRRAVNARLKHIQVELDEWRR
jgi:Flp pilus assembly pilin Flp